MLRRIACLGFVLFAASGLAQTHDSDGFTLALPGYQYQFPRDHGAHFDFRLEWWYYTGNLRCDSSREYGFEVTFFRVGVGENARGRGGERARGRDAERDSRTDSTPPRPLAPSPPLTSQWILRDLAPAHFALTDIGRRNFRFHEKLNRFVPFIADAATDRLRVFNEDWKVEAAADGNIRLRAAANGDTVDLVLTPAKPPVLHGNDGVSVKAAGAGYASHYYSLTRLLTKGTVSSNGRAERCTGLAWMDHEFSSSSLRDNQAGWDWFAIQLDDQTELMLYQMRRRDGTPDENSSGTFIDREGSATHLTATDFRIEPRGTWKSPRTGATYPMGWTLTVPKLGLTLRIEERLRNQELVTSESTQVTYWEGAVRMEGTRAGNAVRGVGYVEMSGYDKALTLP
jgi:predicted secreted hydrolase